MSRGSFFFEKKEQTVETAFEPPLGEQRYVIDDVT